MIGETLLAFLVTSLIIEITPGPNMAYLATLSLTSSRQAGFAAVAGIALGLTVSAVTAAIGLAVIIENSPLIYETLRWGGVAYLLYLAWEGWRREKDATNPAAQATQPPRVAFSRALIVNMLNPKAAVFYIAVLPDIVDPQRGLVMQQTLTLSAIYVAIATSVHFSIVLLAGLIRGRLDSPERRQNARRVLALALAGIAIWFAFSTRRAG